MKTADHEIAVTQDDIDCGCAGDADNCPVARAILRCVPGSSGVCVGDVEIDFDLDGWRRCYDTPDVAARFIVDFDRGAPVAPFSFALAGDGLNYL